MIYLASDHAAFTLKEKVKAAFSSDYNFQDLGTHQEESCHYPDFALDLARKVQKSQGAETRGILLCGSGIGMSMAVNRFQGIRGALCYTEEAARLSRQHNDANVLCLGARTVSGAENLKIVKLWLETEFEGGRHQTRLDLFDQLGEH